MKSQPARPMFLTSKRQRRGATIVEMAIVGPVLFLFIIGMVVAGLGVFRFNQVSALAHEGSRWAAVRGKNFETINKRSTITAEDLYREVIQPRAVGLDLSRLQYSIAWDDRKTAVTVSLSYRWLPEAYFSELIIARKSTTVVSN